MFNCINRCIFRGFISGELIPRKLPSGDYVVNFSIATTIGKTTEFHSIVAYNEVAEAAVKSMGVGDFVHCEGALQTRKMKPLAGEDASARPRKITELIAKEIYLVSKKGVGHSLSNEVNEKNMDLEGSKNPVFEESQDNVSNSSEDEWALPKYC